MQGFLISIVTVIEIKFDHWMMFVFIVATFGSYKNIGITVAFTSIFVVTNDKTKHPEFLSATF